MQTPLQWWRRRGWPARIVVLLIIFYVLYALAGFFILPGMVQKKAQVSLSQLLGRPVTIGHVAINPLTLSITVDRFSVKDPQTGTLVGFKQLYVNAEMWASLFHWRPWVGDIRVDGLHLRLRRAADGALNVDDIIRHLKASGKSARPKPAKKKPAPLPAITVDHLSLSQGDFRFTDAAGKKPVTLTLPVAFTVDHFTTRTPGDHDNHYVVHIKGPDGGTLDWRGRFVLRPLTTQGHLTMSKVDLVSFARLLAPRFYFRVPSGRLGLDAGYRFSASPQPDLTVSQGALTLDNLKIRRQGNDTPSLVFPAITVHGVSLDTAARRLHVPRATIKDPSVKVVRGKQGLDLATLFLPKNPPKDAPGRGPARAGGNTANQGGSDWRVSLDKLAITGAKASLRDQTLQKPADLTLSQGDLTVSDVKVGKTTQWRWQGTATVAGGKLQHRGQGQLAPLKLDADLKLHGLSLSALQPWVHSLVPLTVKSGRADGDVKLAVSGKQPSVSITGTAGLDGVKVEEGGQPFVSLGSLKAKGLDVNSGSHLVAVTDLSADRLDFVNRIDKQGQDSVSRLTASGSGKKAGSSNTGAANPGPSWRVKLGTVSVKNSSITHHDNSLSPPFQVALRDWNGTLKGFDTAAGNKARLRLTGKVNGDAPLSAKGTVSAQPLFVDLDVSMSSYGMNNLTPYTGRYLGYKVQRGLLTVDSTVKIHKQKLESDTKLNADRFYLGDSVNSDQALSIPVKLSLAVLRDASGEIDLPLSVSGDMSDPSFSVAGLVFRVIRNVLVKAATSPFSFLASLVGGQDLNQIAFPPAQEQPSPGTRQKLASLAEVLQKRPALKVVISGQAGQPDRKALAKKAVTDNLGGNWPGLDKALSDQGWRNRILDQYQSRLNQDPDSIKVAGQGVQARTERARQAWQQLIAAAEKTVTPEQLRTLAAHRAQAAEKTLTGEYKTQPDRISLGTPVADSDMAGIKLGLDHK